MPTGSPAAAAGSTAAFMLTTSSSSAPCSSSGIAAQTRRGLEPRDEVAGGAHGGVFILLPRWGPCPGMNISLPELEINNI